MHLTHASYEITSTSDHLAWSQELVKHAKARGNALNLASAHVKLGHSRMRLAGQGGED